VFNDVDLRATFDVQSPTTITLPSTIDPRGGVANFHPIVLPDGTSTHYRDVANYYNFDEFVPTPEPASFLLLAAGTLTLLRLRQHLLPR
jgi:hypothetical protein